MIDWETFKLQLQTNPDRTLGVVLGLSAFLLLIWLAVVVHSSEGEENQPVAVSADGRLDSLRLSLDGKKDGRKGPPDAPGLAGARPAGADSLSEGDSARARKSPAATDEPQQAQPDPSLRRSRIDSVLPTMLVMMVFIGGLWYWIRRRTRKGDAGEPAGKEFFKVRATREIFPGQNIALVEINGEYWIVGGGEQGLRVLHRYRPGEWDDPLPAGEESGGSEDWKSYFSKALGGGSLLPGVQGHSASTAASGAVKSRADHENRNGKSGSEAGPLW